MADIFISYSNSDRPRAKALAEAIEERGWSVWWDRKIPLGKSWDQVIEDQVDAARCMIVLWSKESISSTWVKTEAREGKARGILIPVLTDDAKIPLEFRHMQAANLTGWQTGAQSIEFDQLLAHIAEMLGSPPGTKATIGEETQPKAPAESAPQRGGQPRRASQRKSAATPPARERKPSATVAAASSAEANVSLMHTL